MPYVRVRFEGANTSEVFPIRYVTLNAEFEYNNVEMSGYLTTRMRTANNEELILDLPPDLVDKIKEHLGVRP